MRIYFLTLVSIVCLNFSFAQESNPLFRIIEGGKFGFINKQGKVVIQPVFNYAYDFSEGLAVARKEGKYGYIDKLGNWIVRPKFDFAEKFQNGLAIVQLSGKSFLIDKKGQFQFLKPFETLRTANVINLYWFSENGKSGLCDSKGTVLLEPKYRQYHDFTGKFAIIEDDTLTEKGKKYRKALVNISGQIVIPFGRYDEMNDIGDGYLFLEKYPNSTDKMNPSGEVALFSPSLKRIDCKFPIYPNSFPYKFSEGLITIFLPKKTIKPLKFGQYNNDDFYVAFADTLGNIVLNDSSIFQATPFKFGISTILKNGMLECVDKSFKVIPNIKFEEFRSNRDTEKHSFISNVMKYVLVTENDIKCVFFKNTDLIYRKYDHKGILKQTYVTQYSGNNYFNGSEIIDIVKRRQDLTSLDYKGLVNGLLCVNLQNKLCYFNSKGRIVWKQNNSKGYVTKDVRYYPDDLGSNAKLAERPNYKCGSDSSKLLLIDNSDLFKNDSVNYHFELLNTTCDTLYPHQGIEIGLGLGGYNFFFGSVPFLGHRECGIERGRGFVFKFIPPQNSVVFTIPKTTGCCKAIFRLNVKTIFYDGVHPITIIDITSNQFEGKVTPEVYNDGWLDFIDEFYYKSLHSAFQNSSGND